MSATFAPYPLFSWLITWLGDWRDTKSLPALSKLLLLLNPEYLSRDWLKTPPLLVLAFDVTHDPNLLVVDRRMPDDATTLSELVFSLRLMRKYPVFGLFIASREIVDDIVPPIVKDLGPTIETQREMFPPLNESGVIFS